MDGHTPNPDADQIDILGSMLTGIILGVMILISPYLTF